MKQTRKVAAGKRSKPDAGAIAARDLQRRLQERMQIEFDGICEALMEQARKGHYNAAQLLLKLAGLEGGPAEPLEDTDLDEAKSFLLDLVDELLVRKPETKAD